MYIDYKDYFTIFNVDHGDDRKRGRVGKRSFTLAKLTFGQLFGYFPTVRRDVSDRNGFPFRNGRK